MKLMVQFPTRGRPNQFLDCFKLYVHNLSGNNDVFFNINCDTNDTSMNNDVIKNEIFSIYNKCIINFNNNETKIDAINNNINDKSFDVILNASDDMNPQVKEYDEEIRKGFEEYFADYDGVLHFNDGVQGPVLNTLCILGKPYYERFGYIYHPDYKCVYCDNEFMEISRILKKSIYIDKLIIKHDHVTVYDSINYGKFDETHRSGSCKESRDQSVFQRRRNLRFPQIKITDD